MSTFQLLAVGTLLALVCRDVLGYFRRPTGSAWRLLRAGVWVLAGGAILNPLLVQSAAELLGIGRGADAVLYLSVLVFLWVSFALYARQLRLERQITQIVRHVAIHEATPGGAGE
jgi:hypothetical protein